MQGHSTSNVIYLEKDHKGNQWVANFSEHHDGQGIYDLFGTYSLPTPFTLKANVVEVKQEIEKKNPGSLVVLA